jgi:hypothetical protein
MKALFAFAAAVVAVSVWAVAADAGRAQHQAGTVQVVEHAVTDAVTNGTKADARGNVLTFANPVYDATDTTKVGTDNGFCVRTVKGKTWECMWTTFLQGGQISVEGPFSDTGNTVLSIIGGTGVYDGAHGSMELNYHNVKGTEFDFVFHLS